MTSRRHSRYGYRRRRPEPPALRTVAAWLAGPAVVALFLSGLGLLLPANQRASRSLTIEAAPDVIWQLLMDLDNHPLWRRGLTRIERLPDREGRPVWLEYRGGEAEVVRAADVAPLARLVTETVADDGAVEALWIWELARLDRGSQLTLTRQVRTNGVVARALGVLLQGSGRQVDRTLADLVDRLNAADRYRATALHTTTGVGVR